MGDFLKRDVKTPLTARFVAAGVCLRIDTNSEAILAMATANLEIAPSSSVDEDFRMKLWVDDEDSPCSTSRPYFRGLGHLVFSGYDERSSLMVNLRECRGAGRFSQNLASNGRFWKAVLFPSLLGIVGPSLGLTSLHCACVAWKGQGLLLSGDAGAGKSSLSLALAQAGMDFLSDDRTLVSERQNRLTAFGLSTEMKQRADAALHFPQLANLEFRDLWKGERVFRFDPSELLGLNRVRSCEPRWVVFLERVEDPAFSLKKIGTDEATLLLQRDLHLEFPETAAKQRATIESLSKRACFQLRYGGSPHVVAGALRDLVLGEASGIVGFSLPEKKTSHRAAFLVSDPLRRFRATCLRSDVVVMGRRIRIETDNPLVLKSLSHVFANARDTSTGYPHIVWRIVTEERKGVDLPVWPMLRAFSSGSLRYIQMGPRGFTAVDLAAREAVGVLSERLCEDVVGFATVFLAGMLHLSAPALGLTAVSAACVARDNKGLLLFGKPNSGKSTASYWGKKLGLQFHSDQATFLELNAGTVQAWGDFWPAAFREETVEFVPELASIGRPFTYQDRRFLCVDKTSATGVNAAPVVPVACVVLERQASVVPRLIPISGRDVEAPLLSASASREDHKHILELLDGVPIYRLRYDADPRVAALFFKSVLDAHQLMEQRQ